MLNQVYAHVNEVASYYWGIGSKNDGRLSDSFDFNCFVETINLKIIRYFCIGKFFFLYVLYYTLCTILCTILYEMKQPFLKEMDYFEIFCPAYV